MVTKRIKKYADEQRKESEKRGGKISFKINDLVMMSWFRLIIKNVMMSDKFERICNKFSPKYKGVYEIVEIKGNC